MCVIPHALECTRQGNHLQTAYHFIVIIIIINIIIISYKLEIRRRDTLASHCIS